MGHPQIRQHSDSFRVLGSTQGLGARAADDYDNFFDESQWDGAARFESGRGSRRLLPAGLHRQHSHGRGA